MNAEKSIYNACPICKLPRGKGKYEFAHGKCAEIRAVTEGKKKKFPNDKKFGRITIEQSEKAQRKKCAERYKNGKLPSFMYD